MKTIQRFCLIVLEERVGCPESLPILGSGSPSNADACQHNQKLIIGSWENH